MAPSKKKSKTCYAKDKAAEPCRGARYIDNCKKCGSTEHYVSCGTCVKCSKANNALYRKRTATTNVQPQVSQPQPQVSQPQPQVSQPKTPDEVDTEEYSSGEEDLEIAVEPQRQNKCRCDCFIVTGRSCYFCDC